MAYKGPSRALENMAIKWLCDNKRRYGPSPIPQCCEHYGESSHDKAVEKPHPSWGGISERDLLELARRSLWWRCVAVLAGFTLTTINKGWPHKDEGRRVIMPQLSEVQVKYNKKTHAVSLSTQRIV